MGSPLLDRARRFIDESRQFRADLEAERANLENQIKKLIERFEHVEEALRELPLPGGQAALPLESNGAGQHRLPPDLSDPRMSAPEVVLKVLEFLGGWATAGVIFKVARDGGYAVEGNDLLYSALSRMSRADDGRLKSDGAPGKRIYGLPGKEVPAK